MTDTSGLSVSVVVPCRNSRDTLAAALERLRRLTPPPLEILLADDGSDPPLEDIARSFAIGYLRLDPGRGPAAARNAGAEAARGDIVLFIDADVLAETDIIGRLTPYFADPAVDAVQGIYAAETPSKRIAARYQNDYYHFVFSRAARDTAICATFCFAVRRSVFREMGGFDTRILKPTVEDEIFGYRLAAAGHRIRLAPEIRVEHLADYTVPALLKRKFRMSFYQARRLWSGHRAPKGNETAGNTSHHPLDIRLAVLSAPLLPVAWTAGAPFGLPMTVFYMMSTGRLALHLWRKRGVQALFYWSLMWLDQCVIWTGLVAGTFSFLLNKQ